MAAPFACFSEEWRGPDEFGTMSDAVIHKGCVDGKVEGPPEVSEDLREIHNGGTAAFRSVEDLVKDFDEKLSAFFRHRNATETDTVPPGNAISEETLLKKDEIWNALTDNYGNVMPVDWKQSRTRSLIAPMFNPEEKPRTSDVTTELSDDEELREQLDMHTIIVSCLSEEPLFTAEQVIEEIEEMMQDSPDTEAEPKPSQSDLSMLSLDIQCSDASHSYEERVRALSVAELNECLEETEAAIRKFSEELIQHLALRDELDFEKEVKNSFISVLIDVQNRQKELRELLKKKKKLKSGGGTSQGCAEKTQAPGSYLTTVIPYEKKGGPPSIEDLQILTKILQAMKDDSDKVPSLLTDYILKVLCPT
ncbi:fasciculation and elongation protein zeta-2 [Lampris incognitus]|uniref:fasciculation and elongation protein zeta-2 n=1 Tax=Lampris incognitus TaxID=2546036 RepID=UPI0024B54F3B|nr:fasciculation and elongation protein zeta-2 [Lampris incognitus]